MMKIFALISGFFVYLVGFYAAETIIHSRDDGTDERIDYFYVGKTLDHSMAFDFELARAGTNDNLQQVADGRSCSPRQTPAHPFILAYRSRVMIENYGLALSIQNPNTSFYIYTVEATDS